MEEEEDGVDPIGEDSHTDTDIQNVSYLVVFELFRKLSCNAGGRKVFDLSRSKLFKSSRNFSSAAQKSLKNYLSFVNLPY
jgi:hypothetical protein